MRYLSLKKDETHATWYQQFLDEYKFHFRFYMEKESMKTKLLALKKHDSLIWLFPSLDNKQELWDDFY